MAWYYFHLTLWSINNRVFVLHFHSLENFFSFKAMWANKLEWKTKPITFSGVQPSFRPHIFQMWVYGTPKISVFSNILTFQYQYGIQMQNFFGNIYISKNIYNIYIALLDSIGTIVIMQNQYGYSYRCIKTSSLCP